MTPTVISAASTQLRWKIRNCALCRHVLTDGTLLVGDGSDAPVDVQDDGGYKIENDPFLYVLNLQTGKEHRVAQHNTSWKVLEGDRQVMRPHPSFTPDNKRILFTSDVDGKPALYLAAVPDSVWK